MASEVKTPSMKQLKVDNWATFFMQRLQLLFAKGDSCDITLKFFTGQELKVHSLVLRTCTSHFETLPKDDNVISLPEALSYSAVFPIINFMYSGKLEFKPELHSKLLAIAKILNITILLKLLIAQRDGSSPSTVKARAITSTPEGYKPSPQQLIIQQTTPQTSFGLFSGKKLPFWRKRTFRDRKPVEDQLGPTRFNWPENEPTDWILISSPSFCPLSYETEPILRAPVKIEPDRMSLPPRRIIESRLLTTHDSDDDDDDRFETNYSSDDEASPTPPPPTPPPPSLPSAPPVLKPCLKSPSTESPSNQQSKKVRFSLGPEGKENSVNSAQITQTSASNHAKIIAEVLKKYPDLVKNKNIKLKISSPKPKVENGVNNDEKASYVVLRPTGRTASGSAPITSKNELNTGPWSCEHCPEIKFEQYQDFRKHILEAHNGKLDARICEYCGYKASKRNLHLYHLFTKHNVPPPKNINFPKCPECTYIALSESLLTKHMNNHIQAKEAVKDIPKENQCDICKVVMRNHASLCAHKVTCKPGNEPRNIICDLCKSAFRTNVSLNAHLKECQGKPATTAIFTEDGDQPVEMIEVPIIEAANMEKGDHTLVQLPSGIILADNQNVALLPTSDSDGLNGVTTSIATSIALAIPQDQHSAVILLHDNGQEYIVPEFLDSSSFTTGNIAYAGQNQVIYLGSDPGNGNNQDVIHLEEIKINQASPSTSAVHDKNENIQQTLSLVPSSSRDSKSQVTQNVIINVQGELAQTTNAQLEQSRLILVNTSKQINTNSQETTIVANDNPTNRGPKLILGLPEDDESETEEKHEVQVLEGSQAIQDTNSLHVGSSLQEIDKSQVTNQIQASGPSQNTVPSEAVGSFHDHRSIQNNGSSDQEKIVNREKVVEDGVISESTLICIKEDLENESLPKGVQEVIVLDEDDPVKVNKSSQENNISLQLQDKESENVIMNTEIKQEIECVNVQEIALNTSKSLGGVDISSQSVQVINENVAMSIEHSNKKLPIQVIVQQNIVETEQMQVDEGREDMIVDENKDESMDVEENVDPKDSRDAMDVEENPRTGDERVDSLVKDWGFDDDDTEEVIDDPDCKPLRPEIEGIPL